MIYNVQLKPEELQLIMDALLVYEKDDYHTDKLFMLVAAYKMVQEREEEALRYNEEVHNNQ